MKKETFESWLQDYFIGLREFGGIPIVKDNCEDLFENWLENKDIQEIIDLAEKWGQGKIKADCIYKNEDCKICPSMKERLYCVECKMPFGMFCDKCADKKE